jgi:hypothetical protein
MAMKTAAKTNKISFALLFILLITVSSCRFGFDNPYPISQSNDIIEQVIPLKNFDRIEMGNSFQVFIKSGPVFSIVAKGDRIDVEDLEAKINNGKLKVNYKYNDRKRYEMAIFITMPHLIGANFYGASYAEIDNFNENTIVLDASGAASIFVNSDAKNWDISLSGATLLETIGEGKNLDLSLSGSSNFKGSKLFVENIDLNTSGSSRALIYATREIYGNASGSSLVRYRGNPIVDIKLSGSSWVERY